MLLYVRNLAKGLKWLLVLVAFLFLMCGCSKEPIVVEIVYTTPSGIDHVETYSTRAMLDSDLDVAGARDENAPPDKASIDHNGKWGEDNPTATPLLSPSLTETPILSPTIVPTPTLTPTLTPVPTPTATPTLKATPTPNSNAQKLLEDAKKEYDAAVAEILFHRDALIEAYNAMHTSLEANKAAYPEHAAEIQSEIDALQAQIDAVEREAAAKIEVERDKYEKTVAHYTGA